MGKRWLVNQRLFHVMFGHDGLFVMNEVNGGRGVGNCCMIEIVFREQSLSSQLFSHHISYKLISAFVRLSSFQFSFLLNTKRKISSQRAMLVTVHVYSLISPPSTASFIFPSRFGVHLFLPNFVV